MYVNTIRWSLYDTDTYELESYATFILELEDEVAGNKEGERLFMLEMRKKKMMVSPSHTLIVRETHTRC